MLKTNSTTSGFNEFRSCSGILAIVVVTLPSPQTQFLCGPFYFSFNSERSGRSSNVFSFSLRFISAFSFFVCERCRDAAFSATFIFLLQQHIITVIKLQQPKYEKSLFSGMLIIKASCLLKRPLMNGKDKVAGFRVLCCGFPNPLKDQDGRIERRSGGEAKIRGHDLPSQHN